MKLFILVNMFFIISLAVVIATMSYLVFKRSKNRMSSIVDSKQSPQTSQIIDTPIVTPPPSTWILDTRIPGRGLGIPIRMNNVYYETINPDTRNIFTNGTNTTLLTNGNTCSWYFFSDTNHSETYFIKASENPYLWMGPGTQITTSGSYPGTATQIRSFTFTPVDPVNHPDVYFIDSLYFDTVPFRLCVHTGSNIVYLDKKADVDPTDNKCWWFIYQNL